MYSSTCTSTLFWDEYKYKYEYFFFSLSEYKYKYFEKVLKYEYEYILLNICFVYDLSPSVTRPLRYTEK